MYEKLDEKDIEFLGFLHDPVAFTENVIPLNANAPSQWNLETECVDVRNYQFAMLAYDFLYAYDKEKSERENMQIRKGSGDVFNISGRNIGKSFIGFDVDALMTSLLDDGDETCIASFDQKHLRERSEKVLSFIENHKLFQILHLKGQKKTVGRTPHRVATAHGHLQVGVNEKVSGKNKGTDFHGLHYKRLIYDEASYMSDEGTEKRIDSGNSSGYVERYFGIPDLRLGSPLGEILRDPKNKNFICNLPQFCRMDWNEQEKEKKASQYNGESSLAFKLNVIGEPVEGAFGKFDMDRIRKKCYKPSRKIKFFEIDKSYFKDIKKLTFNQHYKLSALLNEKIIVEPLPSKQQIIASDIGTTGSPSEVTIMFGDGEGNWKYHYQISLQKLTTKEQAFVFKWLYDKFQNPYISLDLTNSDGRSIREDLLSFGIEKNRLMDFRMNKNIEVDFLRNQKNQILRGKNGKPEMRVENTKEFGIQLLEQILYNGKIEIPADEKFLKEFAGYLEKKTSSGRSIFDSNTTDHLLDSFILFALCAWQVENKLNKKQSNQNVSIGYI